MNPGEDFILRQLGDVTVVRLETENLMGVIDIQRLTAKLNALLEGGARKVILDLKHVNYAGSAMLGMLLDFWKSVAGAGGRLVLSHTETIDTLLRISRTRQLFEIADDLKSACELMGVVHDQ